MMCRAPSPCHHHQNNRQQRKIQRLKGDGEQAKLLD